MEQRKKRKLRKWVINLICIINFISVLFLGADCQDMGLFIASKIIAFIIFIVSISLITDYEN